MTKNKTVLLCKFSRGLRTHDYLQRRNTEYINNINISKKKKRNQIQKKNSNKKGMSSLHPNHTSVIRFPLNTTLKTEIQFSGTRTRGIGRLLDPDESNFNSIFGFHAIPWHIWFFIFPFRRDMELIETAKNTGLFEIQEIGLLRISMGLWMWRCGNYF